MRWHHQLNEFESTLGVGDGQGGLACFSPWGCKESDTTEWLNWTEWETGKMREPCLSWASWGHLEGEVWGLVLPVWRKSEVEDRQAQQWKHEVMQQGGKHTVEGSLTSPCVCPTGLSYLHRFRTQPITSSTSSWVSDLSESLMSTLARRQRSLGFPLVFLCLVYHGPSMTKSFPFSLIHLCQILSHVNSHIKYTCYFPYQ